MTSVTDEFEDTLMKSFVLELLDPTFTVANGRHCKTRGKMLTTTHLNQLYSQTLIKTKSFMGVLLPSLVTQQITKAIVANKGKPSTSFHDHLVAMASMRRSATHILRGMGTRTDDRGRMYT